MHVDTMHAAIEQMIGGNDFAFTIGSNFPVEPSLFRHGASLSTVHARFGHHRLSAEDP